MPSDRVRDLIPVIIALIIILIILYTAVTYYKKNYGEDMKFKLEGYRSCCHGGCDKNCSAYPLTSRDMLVINPFMQPHSSRFCIENSLMGIKDDSAAPLPPQTT